MVWCVGRGVGGRLTKNTSLRGNMASGFTHTHTHSQLTYLRRHLGRGRGGEALVVVVAMVVVVSLCVCLYIYVCVLDEGRSNVSEKRRGRKVQKRTIFFLP